jgi:hypothetical protein
MLCEAMPHPEPRPDRPAAAQVFVDDSGRRRRWIRVAGSAVTVGCALYVGVVVVGLSQTAVGPLEAVPAGGNGLIAGFPGSADAVPGLLQAAGAMAGSIGGRAHVRMPAHRPLGAAARLGTARRGAARVAAPHPGGTRQPKTAADSGSSPATVDDPATKDRASTSEKASTKSNGSTKNSRSNGPESSHPEVM